MSQFPQLDLIRRGTSYSGQIRLREYTLDVRPLSMQETLQVANEVSDQLSRLSATAKLSVTEATLMAQKTLQLASTSDVGKNDPKFTEHLAGRLTPDELQSLYNQYVDLCEKVNPDLELMKQEELDFIVAELKKNPSEMTKLSRSQLLPVLGSFLFPKKS